MKAKEMFEKLGYKIYDIKYYKNDICYIKGEDDEVRILFDLKQKEYLADIHYEGGIEMTVELHKAITQQMKELGWFTNEH